MSQNRLKFWNKKVLLSCLVALYKYPVLLCRKHPPTSLIVRSAHEQVQHNGVKETLTEIRAKYWIIKGSSLVKSVIYHCVLCRQFEGKLFQPPPPPPLAIYRVKEEPPFSCTAVDFAGPLYVQTFEVMESKKTWICLYTYCVTCALHLDVVPGMSAATFVQSLKKFCARRGLPHKFLLTMEGLSRRQQRQLKSL